MKLVLCVDLDASGELTSCYAEALEDSKNILSNSSLPMPLYFGQLSRQYDANLDIYFELSCDDDARTPVYDLKTPNLKTMTIFSEYAECVYDLLKSLEMSWVSFQTSGVEGGFRLSLSNSGPILSQKMGLLQAGISVLSYTRGFMMTNFRSSLPKTML